MDTNLLLMSCQSILSLPFVLVCMCIFFFYLTTEKHHMHLVYIHLLVCTNNIRSAEIHPYTANLGRMAEGAVGQAALAVADLNAQCIPIPFLPRPEVSLRSTG